MGIGDKLNELLELRKRNINELASTIGVSAQTLYSISRRNNTKVDLDVLQKIADELSVTLDYFCSDNEGKPSESNLDSLSYKIIETFNRLDEENQKTALAYLEFLAAQNDPEK